MRNLRIESKIKQKGTVSPFRPPPAIKQKQTSKTSEKYGLKKKLRIESDEESDLEKEAH